MVYGYARVSTDAQDLTNQVAQLKAAGCSIIFREKISGATAERSQLKKLMSSLAAGDVVVIPAVDRLSPCLGVAAKPERRRIMERTARGGAEAKAEGVKFDWKPIHDVTSAEGSPEAH